MTEEKVTIPKDEHLKLYKAWLKLGCLQAAGVDTWSGYDEAINEYRDAYREMLAELEGKK